MSGHIVLLGDSIFDNAIYVPGGPSVTGHVERLLPADWKVTLGAVDGARVADVFEQLDSIPDDATHLVLSAGGNNALFLSGDLFPMESNDVRHALNKLGVAGKKFALEYRRLVDAIRAQKRPISLCTVYDSVPGLSDADLAGLCVFNDVISRTAFAVEATLIDLRSICDEKTDYAGISPIEPSVSGGAKIARAILDSVLGSVAARKVIAKS